MSISKQQAVISALVDDVHEEDGWLRNAQAARLRVEEGARVHFCGEGSIDIAGIAEIAATIAGASEITPATEVADGDVPDSTPLTVNGQTLSVQYRKPSGPWVPVRMHSPISDDTLREATAFARSLIASVGSVNVRVLEVEQGVVINIHTF